MNEPLRVYVLPVSGGALVAQLALIKELSAAILLFDINHEPHLVMCSSYIGMAANWNPISIDRISSMVESEMLIMNWWPKHLDFLPTALIGVFAGSIYRQGYGVSKMYENLFNNKNITSTEIWTGTYHKDNNREKFFCNKSEGTTLVKRERFEKDRIIYNCEPLTYAEGNIDLLAKVSIASASIPVLVSEQDIFGCEYTDGGTMHASPLTVMSSEILRIINPINSLQDEVLTQKITPREDIVFEEKKNIQDMFNPNLISRRLQLTYFTCYDIDGTINSDEGKTTMFSDVGGSFTSLIESLSIIDRAKSVELLKTIAGVETIEYEHHSYLTTKELSNILKRITNYRHYVLNLFPHGTPSINMLSFTAEDIASKMAEVSKDYGCHIWYLK